MTRSIKSLSGRFEALAKRMDERGVMSATDAANSFREAAEIISRLERLRDAYCDRWKGASKAVFRKHKALEAATLAHQPATAGLEKVLEDAARIVEENQIMTGSEGNYLAPRIDGNLEGLAYAKAIRTLKSEGRK